VSPGDPGLTVTFLPALVFGPGCYSRPGHLLLHAQDIIRSLLILAATLSLIEWYWWSTEQPLQFCIDSSTATR
jgi:hypothetical protein